MNISYPDSYFQTALFLTFLLTIIILTAKKDADPHTLNHSHTNELKGIAILMVIFSHVGYFLFSDHTFLYPVSVFGGVGVNIFLFLSGFGLTSSENMSNRTVLDFYKNRLKNIFIPMWLVLIPLYIFDFYLLGRRYSQTSILQSVLGFFPNPDIGTSINSPLWYFTLILFYYLIFPLVFRKKKPILSAIVILFLGYFMVKLNLPVAKDLLKLYKLHFVAFPLGMLFASIFTKNILKIKDKIEKLQLDKAAGFFLRYLLMLFLIVVFSYTAIHSGIGEKLFTEAYVSLITMATLIFIVLLKKVQSNILIILGEYSYGIYLIQWPLMYRYDFIYKHTPLFLGTLLYIAVFLIIGYVLNRITKLSTKVAS